MINEIWEEGSKANPVNPVNPVEQTKLEDWMFGRLEGLA